MNASWRQSSHSVQVAFGIFGTISQPVKDQRKTNAMYRPHTIACSPARSADAKAVGVPQNYRRPGPRSGQEIGLGLSTSEVLGVLSAMDRLLA